MKVQNIFLPVSPRPARKGSHFGEGFFFLDGASFNVTIYRHKVLTKNFLKYMNSVFITGIPTAGKSYLADKIAKSLSMTHIEVDAIRDEMVKDPILEPWVNFFWHKNEVEYYSAISPEEQWQNIVNQSEAFWSTMKKRIEETLASGRPAIFEGVNLLPHLMQEVAIKGVVILGNSEEEAFERIKADPRWGNTEELQRLEAHAFFTVEHPCYKAEAEKFGYPTFSDPSEAEAELIRLITG